MTVLRNKVVSSGLVYSCLTGHDHLATKPPSHPVIKHINYNIVFLFSIQDNNEKSIVYDIPSCINSIVIIPRFLNGEVNIS